MNQINQDEDQNEGFVDADSFHDWCEINNHIIGKMLRDDPWECLFQAYLGGVSNGAAFSRKLYKNN